MIRSRFTLFVKAVTLELGDGIQHSVTMLGVMAAEHESSPRYHELVEVARQFWLRDFRLLDSGRTGGRLVPLSTRTHRESLIRASFVPNTFAL